MNNLIPQFSKAAFVLALGLVISLDATARVPRAQQPADTVRADRNNSPKHKPHKTPPEMDERATPTQFDDAGFAPDPVFDTQYSVEEQLDIYGGKTYFDAPRPLIEWGYPQYAEGPIGAGHSLIGSKNLVRPQFLVYGDLRTAVAYNDDGKKEIAQVATRLNLDIDLKLTATERLHAFVRPLDSQKEGFTRIEFGGADANKNADGFKLDGDVETFFFEGDIASLQSGFTDKYAQYDLPFVVGLFPLFLQNGVWLNDAFTGAAFTLPARNSPKFDITNFDITLFVGFDDITSTAFRDANGKLDDGVADLFGLTTFMDVNEGYFEAGYAYLDDKNDDGKDFSYHNLTFAWTARFQNHLSYSARVISNFGQDPGPNQQKTADGYAVLFESSFITSKPYTLLPYLNLFIGVDSPQAVARGNKGLLENTGINFETDNLTGFPTLDDSANDTWGGAFGVQYLFALNQQLVVEVATVQIRGQANDPNRIAKDNQYALGVRYQRPLSDRWIFRTDAIYGNLENQPDIAGIRFEARLKF